MVVQAKAGKKVSVNTARRPSYAKKDPSAHNKANSMWQRIKDKSIFDIRPEKQDKIKEIRYSKKQEFTEKAVEEFLNKKINLNIKNFEKKLLKDPFFLN